MPNFRFRGLAPTWFLDPGDLLYSLPRAPSSPMWVLLGPNVGIIYRHGAPGIKGPSKPIKKSMDAWKDKSFHEYLGPCVSVAQCITLLVTRHETLPLQRYGCLFFNICMAGVGSEKGLRG